MNKLMMVAAALTVALSACGGGQEDDEAAPADDAGQNRHLLDAARQPLDRARQVEDVSAERKNQLEEEIRAAGDQ